MHRLSARELRRSRTYLWAWWAGWFVLAILCGLALGAMQLGDDVVRQPLGSTGYVLMGLFPAWLGTVVTLHWAPRLTFAFGALLGVLFEAAPVHDDVRGLGWAAAVFAVAGLVWFLWRDSRSTPHGPHVVPANGTQWEGSWAADDARIDAKVGALVAGAFALLTLIGLGVHHFMLSDVAAFEARAELAAGTVVELIEDPYEMVVEVGGREFTFERFYTDEEQDEPQPGEAIEVLIDGDRATPLGQGQGNPAFVLGITAVAPLLGAAIALRLGTRRSRRRALLERGGPSATVRLLWLEEFDALALPVDDTVPTLRLINLTGLRELDPGRRTWKRRTVLRHTPRMMGPRPTKTRAQNCRSARSRSRSSSGSRRPRSSTTSSRPRSGPTSRPSSGRRAPPTASRSSWWATGRRAPPSPCCARAARSGSRRSRPGGPSRIAAPSSRPACSR